MGQSWCNIPPFQQVPQGECRRSEVEVQVSYRLGLKNKKEGAALFYFMRMFQIWELAEKMVVFSLV